MDYGGQLRLPFPLKPCHVTKEKAMRNPSNFVPDGHSSDNQVGTVCERPLAM